MVRRTEAAAEDDVPVENTAGLVRHRLGHVVAFDEHGVETGNATTRHKITGALKKLRQTRKNTRRVTF